MTTRVLGTVALGTAVALTGASAASATDCVIGVHSTNAPASSNWETVTALQGAEWFAGWTPQCDAQVDAGYAALKAAQLPSALKIFTTREIGENSKSPRMADGHGLDHFDAGSPYPDLVLGTFLGAATAVSCS
jgi:hypothetical protein